MRSRHRKQRQWRKEIDENAFKKGKGATVGAVHPSEKQTFNPSRKDKGVTLGKISNLWPPVKWERIPSWR